MTIHACLGVGVGFFWYGGGGGINDDMRSTVERNRKWSGRPQKENKQQNSLNETPDLTTLT